MIGRVQCYDTSQQPPTVLWTVELNTYTNSNATMRLFGSVLVVVTAGQCYRLDTRTGETLKLEELSKKLEAHLTFMEVHRHMAYMNSGHRVVALDRDRLKKVWKSSDLGERFECGEVAGTCLMVACDGEVYALDLITGRTVFSIKFEGPRNAITLLGDDVTFGPERPLCYVGHCGKISVIDVVAQSKLETEMLVSEDASFGVAMQLHRGILVAASGGVAMGFQTPNFQECWLLQYGHETGHGFMSSLHCLRHDGKDLAIIGSNGYALSVDITSGTQLWLTSLPRGGYAFVSSLLYDDVLYIASNGRLWSLSLSSGEVLWEMKLNGMGDHSPLLLSTISRNKMASDTPILQAQKRTPAFSLFR